MINQYYLITLLLIILLIITTITATDVQLHITGGIFEGIIVLTINKILTFVF